MFWKKKEENKLPDLPPANLPQSNNIQYSQHNEFLENIAEEAGEKLPET